MSLYQVLPSVTLEMLRDGAERARAQRATVAPLETPSAVGRGRSCALRVPAARCAAEEFA